MDLLAGVTLQVQLFSNAGSILLFLSPLLKLLEIQTKGCAEGHSSLPYTVTWLCCGIWFSYGLSINDIFVSFPNLVGLMVSAFGLFVLYDVAAEKKKIRVLRNFVVLSVTPGILIGALALTSSSPANLLGTCGVILATIMLASPLVQAGTVIMNRSTAAMSFPLAVVTMMQCTSWLMYAYLSRDVFMAIPNALGLIAGIAQVLLFVLVETGTKLPVCMKRSLATIMESSQALSTEGLTEGEGTSESSSSGVGVSRPNGRGYEWSLSRARQVGSFENLWRWARRGGEPGGCVELGTPGRDLN